METTATESAVDRIVSAIPPSFRFFPNRCEELSSASSVVAVMEGQDYRSYVSKGLSFFKAWDSLEKCGGWRGK